MSDLDISIKAPTRFMGVGQVLALPLFFASSAIYSTAILLDGLKVAFPLAI